jgi:hypothetical protein
MTAASRVLESRVTPLEPGNNRPILFVECFVLLSALQLSKQKLETIVENLPQYGC